MVTSRSWSDVALLTVAVGIFPCLSHMFSALSIVFWRWQSWHKLKTRNEQLSVKVWRLASTRVTGRRDLESTAHSRLCMMI
jgi:hypothetical protein